MGVDVKNISLIKYERISYSKKRIGKRGNVSWKEMMDNGMEERSVYH